jgi:hypothetical protein
MLMDFVVGLLKGKIEINQQHPICVYDGWVHKFVRNNGTYYARID